MTNPLARITIKFLTQLVLCLLISYMNYGTYTFKSPSNNRFLKNFSLNFILLLQFLPEICWKEVTDEIHSSFFWICLVWAIRLVQFKKITTANICRLFAFNVRPLKYLYMSTLQVLNDTHRRILLYERLGRFFF